HLFIDIARGIGYISREFMNLIFQMNFYFSHEKLVSKLALSIKITSEELGDSSSGVQFRSMTRAMTGIGPRPEEGFGALMIDQWIEDAFWDNHFVFFIFLGLDI
ncbi:hypothetical protein ACJX0J_034781, partial [Zea mays]